MFLSVGDIRAECEAFRSQIIRVTVFDALAIAFFRPSVFFLFDAKPAAR